MKSYLGSICFLGAGGLPVEGRVGTLRLEHRRDTASSLRYGELNRATVESDRAAIGVA